MNRRGVPAITDAILALDLDGTLIDARLRQVGVAAEAFEQLTASKLSSERFWRSKREGATTLQAIVELGFGESLAGELARAWAERIETDEWLAEDRPIPGARELLASLQRDGISYTVLTARRRPGSAERSIRAAGLEELIPRLVVVDPALNAQQKAVALRDCGAEVYIGDSETDGVAAALAHTPFIAVATGQRSAPFLRAHGHEVAASLGDAVDRALPRREAA